MALERRSTHCCGRHKRRELCSSCGRQVCCRRHRMFPLGVDISPSVSAHPSHRLRYTVDGMHHIRIISILIFIIIIITTLPVPLSHQPYHHHHRHLFRSYITKCKKNALGSLRLEYHYTMQQKGDLVLKLAES